jgi:L-lactate dehydrogenase complex protein LldE
VRVQLFATCLVDGFFPQVGVATVRVLERLGHQVEFPLEQTCCGQPAFNAGYAAEALRILAHMLPVLDATEGPIVTPSGSCADMLVHHAPRLVVEDPELGPLARRVAERVRELTQFLVDDLRVEELGSSCGGCVAAYHPSCHGLRNLGLGPQAVSLLRQVEGLVLVELPGAEECCGFGGLFSVELPEVSAAIMEIKLENVLASGARMLVGSDVSCLMHLAGGLHRRGATVEVRHIAEVLAGEEGR